MSPYATASQCHNGRKACFTLIFFDICIVNENDGNGAAGKEFYRSGQAEKSLWAGRKKQ
jgi:hypothetical protein